MKGVWHEIRSDIAVIEEREALYREMSFADRAEALDAIEFHILDRIEGLLRRGGRVRELVALKRRAERVRERLEAIDARLFCRLRAKIRSGEYTGAEVRRWFVEVAGYDPGQGGGDEAGYDSLDVFLNGLLRIDVAPREQREREPEMVFYQPTPARVILELVDAAKIGGGDVFYDLGSGLGQVPILVNLLTGARAVGVEFEPAYCAYARECAERLKLSRVEFVHLDAREADYADGTVFFMYTPFEGRMLQEVLDRLREEARKRALRIGTYGPCTRRVSEQGWLRCADRSIGHEYKLALFSSVSQDL